MRKPLLVACLRSYAHAQVCCSLGARIASHFGELEFPRKIFDPSSSMHSVCQRGITQILLVDNHLEEESRIPGISFGILSLIAHPLLERQRREEEEIGTSTTHSPVLKWNQ